MREDSPPADTRKRKSSAGLDCGVTRKGAPPARKNEGSAKNPPKGRFVRGVLYVAATLRQCTQDKKPRPTKHLGCNVRTRTFSAWTAENIRHLREFQSRTGSRRCRAGWLPRRDAKGCVTHHTCKARACAGEAAQAVQERIGVRLRRG